MSKLCQIHRVKNSFDQKTLLIISALVIIKLLHYSTTVWANTRAPKIVKKLQAIQNFVCKIVTNTSMTMSPALRQLNLATFKETVRIQRYSHDL